MKLIGSKTIIAGAIALLIAGCGGSSGTRQTDQPATVAGTEAGVLVDSPIQGVTYVTSSGVRGTTDADGRYDFNPGDTVSFYIGALELGTVTATGVVTPVALAAGNDDRLVNLLVLLQSLDGDGDPENGIEIRTASAAAITSPTQINLNVSPATFASSNPALQDAMTAGGVTGTIKTPAEAKQHFLNEGAKLFSSAVWFALEGNGGVMLRFGADGKYIIGEAFPDDYSGLDENNQIVPTSCVISTAGVEYNSFVVADVDKGGFYLAQGNEPDAVDTAGQGGLGGVSSCDEVADNSRDRLRPVGTGLDFVRVGDDGSLLEEGTAQPMENQPNGIVGAWALSATDIKTQTFLFFSNGKFMMSDPLGDTENNNPNCGPGVEFGTYSYNASTSTLTVTGVTYNTNGCAGLVDTDGSGNDVVGGSVTWTLSGDGLQATISDGGSGGTPAYRISR